MNAPNNTALVAQQAGALARVEETALIETLRASLYPGARLESVAAVIGYCKAAGLDPLDKPVHIVPMPVATGRKDNDGWDITELRDVVMQGIGLYRTKAARTGQYAGQSEPEFGPTRTETLDGVAIEYPEWCKVVVYRLVGGERAPFPHVERWRECYATKSRKSAAPNAMWKRRPFGQLAKTAEAGALRKAFPDAVGAAPTADEMEGRTFDDAVEATPPPAALIQRKSEQRKEDVTDVEPRDPEASDAAGNQGSQGSQPRDAGSPSRPPKADRTISEGQCKWVIGTCKRIGLDAAAMDAFFARHGIEKLDTTISVERFDALRAELMSMT